MDKKLLKFFWGLGLLLVPFAFRRKHLKTLLLTFFIKGYLVSFIDQIVVKRKQLKYPVRNFQNYFKTSILFDYFLFPLLCVFYHRTTEKKKGLAILLNAFFYSIPVTLIEGILEKKTNLIHYKNQWTRWISFATLTGTLWTVRILVVLINKFNRDETKPAQNPPNSFKS